MIPAITSRQNERIKWLRRFQQRRHRDAEGRFLVEGPHLVEEALDAGWAVDLVVHSPETAGRERAAAVLERARRHGVELLAVAGHVLPLLAATVTPQGLVALVRKPPARSLPDVLPEHLQRPLVAVLDGLQDPGNLGTVIRTADAAGVDAVLLTGGTVDLYAPKTVRAAAGSLFHVRVGEPAGPGECAAFLKTRGLSILAADPRDGTPVFDCDLTGPVALVIGNEGAGVGPVLRKAADGLVRVPMLGRAESLNAAVAASLIIYEAVRQRLKAPCV
ncbi:MAG: RNA methyltransferase [Thermoanaerobacterales bacterium]|nr:RNA methyltransferase [Bacillota bacterium]MDI6907514.1 RNA methyltransferase [Thermoanaerobacterales bacterium]